MEFSNEEYIVVNLAQEYTDFIGDSKWLIVSDLNEKELLNNYPELICFQPFILLKSDGWLVIKDAFKEFKRNDDKHLKRQQRREDLFGYIDGETEVFMPMSNSEAILDDVIAEEEKSLLHCAINRLTPTQKRRVDLYYFLDKTHREIAEIESADKKSVSDSLNAALKKLKKYFENTPPK